jgi:type I restriction enzyme S subunit
MTPEQLKASILQYAIQGKLVEQRPEEGTGEELYQQIQAEKQRLIKAGKIKKEKALPEITEDEIPFDIPKTWCWIRLGELIRVIGGVSYKKGDVVKNGIRILRGGNIQSMKVLTDEDDVFLPHEYRDDEKQVKIGDILIVASTGSKAVIGKAGYVDREMPCTMIGAFLRICRPIYFETVEYLRCLFDSDFYRKHIRDLSQGTNINNVKESYITEFVIPFPPLTEQKRIVAKIEEVLPYVDRYADAYEKLEQFNAKFPEDMKKSILQYAIQGKLVEQRPEEGTGEELYRQIQTEKQRLIKEGKIKKEKPLPKITEDELPFDIPESWKWCRLSDVIDVRDGTHDSPKYVPVGIPLVTSKNLVNGIIDYGNVKYITQEDADKINVRSMVDDDDILFAMIGSIGNPVLVKKDREFCIKNMALFKRFANTDISMRYVYWFLFYDQYKLKKEASGGVQSFISLSRFREYLIPLPPVAEQNRIVAKLEEILPLCERLK